MSEKRNMSKVVRTKNNLRPKAVADATARNSGTIADVFAQAVFVIGVVAIIVTAIGGVLYVLLLTGGIIK